MTLYNLNLCVETEHMSPFQGEMGGLSTQASQYRTVCHISKAIIQKHFLIIFSGN